MHVNMMIYAPFQTELQAEAEMKLQVYRWNICANA